MKFYHELLQFPGNEVGGIVARTANLVRESFVVFFFNMSQVKYIGQLAPSVLLGQILQRVATCSLKHIVYVTVFSLHRD